MSNIIKDFLDKIKSTKKETNQTTIEQIKNQPLSNEDKIHQENFEKVADIFLNLEDYRMEIFSLGDYKHKKIKEAEEDIEKILAEDPELLTYQDITGTNIGMLAAYHGMMKSLIQKSLEDPVASCQQDNHGQTIGMHCAKSELEDMVLLALDNKESSLKQDKNNLNIGLLSIMHHLKPAVLKVLEFPELATQDCASQEMLKNDRHMNMLSLCSTYYIYDDDVMSACRECLAKHFEQNPIEEYDVDFNESDELES